MLHQQADSRTFWKLFFFTTADHNNGSQRHKKGKWPLYQYTVYTNLQIHIFLNNFYLKQIQNLHKDYLFHFLLHIKIWCLADILPTCNHFSICIERHLIQILCPALDHQLHVTCLFPLNFHFSGKLFIHSLKHLYNSYPSRFSLLVLLRTTQRFKDLHGPSNCTLDM